MKVKIIKSSELREGCWSALRYLGECVQCDKCFHCKHEEAAIGRLTRRKQKIERLKAEIAETEKRGDRRIEYGEEKF